MNHTITSDDVKALHESLKPRGPKDAFQGLRTEVHEALQAQLPPPHSEFPAHLPAATRRKFTADELDEIHGHMRSKVTDADIIAFERAKAADPKKYRGVVDAHHAAQREHGLALWAEADRLIAAAGIFAPGTAN